MISDFMKKYVNALTGKVDSEKIEPGKVLDIKDMLDNLIRISDEDWGKYAFSREPLNGKFDSTTREGLINKANNCGYEYANNLRERFGNINPQELVLKLNLKVDFPSKPVGGGHVLFAQFVEPNEISIFMDCIEKSKELMCDNVVADKLDNLDVGSVLLAHEIFHYIEEVNKDKIFTKQEKVKLWAPKPFKNESTIVCLGEIAGMAFAKELLHMKFSPYVLDVFLTYTYNPEAASRLYEEIMLITKH